MSITSFISKRRRIAALGLAALVSVATLGASTGSASAATYPCQNSTLTEHTKSGTAVGQDSDGVWHYVGFSIGVSGSVSNKRGTDCVGTTTVAMDNGVTGKYLSNNGFEWKESVAYLNPLDGKYHSLSRQYSSISNPWHWYHDASSPAVFGTRIKTIKVTFSATYDGAPAGNASLTCNVVTNTCS